MRLGLLAPATLAALALAAPVHARPAAKAACVTAQCHATVTKVAFLHGPVGVGDCTVCHSAHAGKGQQTRLVAKGATLCYHCHESRSFATTSRHAALDSGCTGCHAPHGGARMYFVRSEPEALCRSCHSGAAATHAGKGVASTKERCVGCHDPHGSKNIRLLRRPPTTGKGACPRKPAAKAVKTAAR